jgi:hypothetical protein
MPLTLPELYRRTAFRRKESAKYVKLTYTKKGWDSRGVGFIATKSYSTKEWDARKQKYVPHGRSKNRYVSIISFVGGRRLWVDVSCSCADFRYRLDWSLAYHKASDLSYAIDRYPKVRNPDLKAFLCKHLVRLATEKVLPHLPKPDYKTPADYTHVPNAKLSIPPSILKKQQEEQMKKNQQKPATPFVPPKNAQSPATKGLQSPGMSNWIFGG